MKHAFIINPASGNGKKAKALISQLDEIIKDDSRDIKYYVTEGIGDATVLASRLACEAEDADEEIRIYACGGDGTISEVANGIADCENAILGVMPIGSGNDFVRNFDGADFLDVRKQLDAEAEVVDLIKYSFDTEAGPVDKYCVNGMNIGFDGNTAILANELKTHKAITGSFSYLLAVAVNLIQKKGAKLRVSADGEQVYEGNLIMCSIANGRFCGGGIESCPRAEVNNGLLEMLVIKDVTRRKFLQVFPPFMKGKIFEIKGVDEIATFGQPKHVTVEPIEGEMQFVVDGEGMKTGTIEIDIMEAALKVVVPKEKPTVW